MNDEEIPKIRLTYAALLTAVVALGTADIVLDVRGQGFTPHILLELALVVLALGSAVWLARGWRRAADDARRLAAEAERHRADHEHWKTEAARALAGLSAAIDRQLENWELTSAERATARGLLRGLSHRAIADRDGRSERTVRQHAVSVYRKAGVAGRAELAAFFLSALPEPDGGPEPARESGGR